MLGAGDTGVCTGCGAGGDGDDVEIDENGLCVGCAEEKERGGEESLDMGDEMNSDA